MYSCTYVQSYFQHEKRSAEENKFSIKKNLDDKEPAEVTRSTTEIKYTESGPNNRQPDYVLRHDGDYLFVIHMQGSDMTSFQADVELEMKGMCVM